MIASFVLTCVYDLGACLSELHRILKPGGRLLTCDPLRFGGPTVEYADMERITSWYGKEAYERYRIGSFRTFGDVDLIQMLHRHGFVVKTLYGFDPATDSRWVWHMSIKVEQTPLDFGEIGDQRAERWSSVYVPALMAYEDFVAEFAVAQGIESTSVLLRDHAEKYSFQLKSRERAQEMLATVQSHVGDVRGLRVLDVGCAYGSFAIEFAKAGAQVVGIDVNDKWLQLADANARNEVSVPFLKCDAASHPAVAKLREHGPFDLVILNDVLEHIYDTAGLLTNVRGLLKPRGRGYFKVPNGLATRHVLSEGHKKVYGISLIAPDYWQLFVKAPFQIYYRRRAYFDALFEHFGLACEYRNPNHDVDRDQTARHVLADLRKIEAALKPDGFDTPQQYRALKEPVLAYIAEAMTDCASLSWPELHAKYRVTFWEGVLTRS